MTEILKSVIAAIGFDIGKNSFHHPSRRRFGMAACIISAAVPNIGHQPQNRPNLVVWLSRCAVTSALQIGGHVSA
jgi:hypothetical protein